MGALAEFSAALMGKDLDKGSEVILTWRPDGKLEVTVQPPSASGGLTGPRSTAGAIVSSVALCRALFEVRHECRNGRALISLNDRQSFPPLLDTALSHATTKCVRHNRRC
jgi:hypothetical protein